jgi:LysM repeat protein
MRWRRRCAAPLLTAGLLLGGAPEGGSAQSLRGSSASLDRQVAQARRHDFTHLASTGQLRRFVDADLLVHVGGNRDYTLADVSFPFARPEVRLFIERLSSQYRRACNERLVVTSLTRPLSHQPRNASDRSVHPTGMAIDLRRPGGRCRSWLEGVLMSLEARGVLEATRERRPPHYHVAVYPKPYAAYVRELTARAAGGSGATPAADASVFHVVRRGDSLGRIARLYGATIEALRRANGLTSSLIHPGQSLRVPRARPLTARAAGGSGATPAADASVFHVVRRGDSLGRIARLYGATIEALRRANGLTSSLIHPGQSLRVPQAQP